MLCFLASSISGRGRARLGLARLVFAVISVFVASGALSRPAAAAPFRPEVLQLDLDEWIPGDRFKLSLIHRSRYEGLNDQFVAGQSGDDALWAMRTLLHGRLRPFSDLGLTLGAELQDSRVYESGSTTLTTTMVNAAELLRAYVELERDDVFGGRLRATGGRITMDVGSRRLVARNRYRNTINGFTGIDVEWTSQADHASVLRAFWTLPVDRRPRNGSASQAKLQRNQVEFDEENIDVQFWGLVGSRKILGDSTLELFTLGLHEDDSGERPTKNRELYTHGLRFLRKPSKGRFDFLIETALQHGRSRATTSSSDTSNLDHLAHFEHAELGYSFDAPWHPRAVLQFDYASGDEKPTDDENNRFDTLYGARRFDFGPTGIYGPFARSNLITPGGRIRVQPLETVSALVSYRAFWLAEKRDAWTTTSVQDTNGNSGTFVGHQIELAGRWQLIPEHVVLEAGYAHLFAGEFIRKAPNSNRQGDSDYVYTQATLSF